MILDIHEFYENILLNDRIPVADKVSLPLPSLVTSFDFSSGKIFESRRFASRWERSPTGPFGGLLPPSGSPTSLRPQAPPRLPSRPSSRRSLGPPEATSFLQTSPVILAK